ncbi:Nucleoside hydrolase [Sphingomonas aurantiaca]|uniref:Nucleoside hydrolase n=1 Tax=Sphingomonas aurantiaca TaxID=185949 RepID=A0A5E7Z8J4_9SPHN|nr:nucleoside hydrolase [Sphingomonas aurantiaca]VVT15233.1 Nucleoside hydrolase [Sphingomonas aurantiaca]
MRRVLRFGVGWSLVLALAGPVAASSGRDAPTKRLVLIDDDVVGLSGAPALLLQAPDVEVLGITTTSGSVWRDTATAYALRTVEIVGRADVPVVPGATYPLLNNEAATARWEGLYGRLEFKGPWTAPAPGGASGAEAGTPSPAVVPSLSIGNPVTKPSSEIAAAFLVRMVRAHPHQITLFATGPMTNIAIAQSLDPSFAANVKELVYMGGSLSPQQTLDTPAAAAFARGFLDTPRREFNIRWDPEAARIMAHGDWPKVTMVPIDPSTGTQWTRAFLDSLKPTHTTLTDALRTGLEPGFPMWDEIAAMAWLEPGIVTRAKTLYIDFDTSQTAGYGDTLSWQAAYRPHLGERAQTVVLRVDRAKMETAMRALYMRRIRR